MNEAKCIWACRRGMLELDRLLTSFTKKHYANLSAKEQGQLWQLLQQDDDSLYLWFIEQQIPPTEFSALIAHILQAYHD